MKPSILEAARRLLFLSIAEAAEHLGEVSEQTWRRWEAGKLEVPEDVAARIESLIIWRGEMIDAALQASDDATDQDDLILIWYDAPADLVGGASVPIWRAQQSVCAELMGTYNFRLVQYDADSCNAWLREHGRKDSSEMRAMWAAQHEA